MGDLTDLVATKHSCSECCNGPNQSYFEIIDTLAANMGFLNAYQISASVYLADYLLKVTPELSLEGDLVSVQDANFIMLVSRGFLIIPILVS